jgi:NAD(P)H-hydrate epimerase
VLSKFAARANAVILFKSHVMYAASPDGRIAVIDGMNPILSTGGTGDVLAGFCASIAARWRAAVAHNGTTKPFDSYICASTASSLLVKAAKSESVTGKFVDPEEIACAATAIAGAAWLPAAYEAGE